MSIHRHYIGRVWQQKDTVSHNQLMQLPADTFAIELRIRRISLYTQQDSSTGGFLEVRHPITVKSIPVPRLRLLSDHKARFLLSFNLSRMGVPVAEQEPIIQSFCALVRSMTSGASNDGSRTPLPIVVGIVVMTRESMEAEMLKPMPATKSSIEALEKVRLVGSDSMEQCIICLEKFSVGFDVSRLPCSHVYHGDCIVQWLETSHLCPVCRFPMPC